MPTERQRTQNKNKRGFAFTHCNSITAVTGDFTQNPPTSAMGFVVSLPEGLSERQQIANLRETHIPPAILLLCWCRWRAKCNCESSRWQQRRCCCLSRRTHSRVTGRRP